MPLSDRPNSTSYVHPQESNLLNLHKSMEYNAAGQPVVRVSVGEGISINGNVIIPGTVQTVITQVGTSGPLTVPYLPVQGNVNAVINSGNVTVVQGTVPWTISGNVNASIAGIANVAFAGTNVDAFGRLRVSNSFTLFDSSFRYGDRTDIWDTSVTGTGQAVYDSNAKTVSMSVHAAGDAVIRETRTVFQYQPGKSLLIFNTFCMTAPRVGLRQRVGYFGAHNGIFLEADGVNISLVIRKDITGTVSDSERQSQSSWNGDTLLGPLDPNCPSGITLDLSKPQIFWMDIEWLGVGSVRCGFVINGVFHVCHTFHHANQGTLTGPYMATACLPIRYELTSTGSSSGVFTHICNSVISEGGYEPKPKFNSASMGINSKSLSSNGTYYPMVSLRLNSLTPDAIIRLAQMQTMISTNSNTPRNCHFIILKNATLTGANWVTHSSGNVDYDLSATAFSGGSELLQGYFTFGTRVDLGGISDFNYQLGRSITGVSETVTVVVTADSNNTSVALELGWFSLT
jgi:hypothetical protein